MRTLRTLGLVLALLALTPIVYAQAPTTISQSTAASPIVLVPISATSGAVGTQTTLTIPAPPGGMYNYVCYLSYEVGADNTGGALANVVSTSTNFNALAVKVSLVATASTDSGSINVINATAPGCAKSATPTTATTFVSPAGGSLPHAIWTWYALYFQAP